MGRTMDSVSRTGSARLGEARGVATAASSSSMTTGAASDIGRPDNPVPTTWSLSVPGPV